jgi:hypothetical protein
MLPKEKDKVEFYSLLCPAIHLTDRHTQTNVNIGKGKEHRRTSRDIVKENVGYRESYPGVNILLRDRDVADGKLVPPEE